MPEDRLNLTAEDIMTSPVITIASDASLADAARVILESRIGCLPVLNDSGEFLGLITDDSFFPQEKRVPYTRERLGWLFGGWLGDVDQLGVILRSLRDRKLTDGLIERSPVAPDVPVREVIDRLQTDGVHHVVVAKDRQIVGVISRHDMAKLVLMACWLAPGGDW